MLTWLLRVFRADGSDARHVSDAWLQQCLIEEGRETDHGPTITLPILYSDLVGRWSEARVERFGRRAR